MGRPIKQVVDYFPHQVNKGKTKLVLQNEFGNDGYAFWFQLLELLCVSDNQVYDYNNPASWRLLLAVTHVNEDTAISILQLLADLGAIDAGLNNKRIIWSQNLVDNLELVYRRRATGIPEKPVIVDNNPINVNKNRHTKLNNTKLNNTKLNNTKEDGNIVLSNKIQQFNTYKTKLIERYPGLDIEDEWERCQIWYRDHNKTMKSPSLALGNWCRKEMKIKQKQEPEPENDEPIKGLTIR